MKTTSEKEKKLDLALSKLKNLSLENPGLQNSIENLDDINQQKEIEKKKEAQFYEKMDELNQETDTLLEEIDRWQM